MDPIATSLLTSTRTLSNAAEIALDILQNRQTDTGEAPTVRSLLDAAGALVKHEDIDLAYRYSPEAITIIASNFVRAQRDLKAKDIEHCEAMIASQLPAACGLFREHETHRLADLKTQESSRVMQAILNIRWFKKNNAQVHEELEVARGILKDTAARIESFVDGRSDVAARKQLARGLLCSNGIALVVLLCIAGAATLLDQTGILILRNSGQATVRDFLVCIGGGALGAATSVIFRLRKLDRLRVDDGSFGAAAFRVVLGVLFAFGILLLLKGHIVDILKEPQAIEGEPLDVTAGFFWAAAGFLAGFNERWVGRLLDKDKKRPRTI